MAKAKELREIFQGNGPFEAFRASLEARGVHVSIARVLDGSDRGARCAFLCFTGDGFQPAILTAVAFDYGPRDGFGLYYPATTNKISDDVAAIVGKPAQAA